MGAPVRQVLPIRHDEHINNVEPGIRPARTREGEGWSGICRIRHGQSQFISIIRQLHRHATHTLIDNVESFDVIEHFC